MGNLISNDDKKKLIIIRGLPGSGKSTIAKGLAGKEGMVICTDDFFTTDGVYKYDSHHLKDSHKWAQSRAKVAMEEGHPLVIIDNTNVRKWEAKPYVQAGVDNKYKIEFIETNTSWARNPVACFEKNIQGVPLPVIDKMNREWEDDFTVENVINSKAPWEK